jgi:hypothetical protein
MSTRTCPVQRGYGEAGGQKIEKDEIEFLGGGPCAMVHFGSPRLSMLVATMTITRTGRAVITRTLPKMDL